MSEAATIARTTLAWAPRSVWAGYARPGRQGRAQGEAGLRVGLKDGFGLASVIAVDGREESLGAALAERFGLALPAPGTCAFAGGTGLVWSAPGQWLAVSERRAGLDGLAASLSGVAAVADQSDSRGLLAISGRRAREVLEKGVSLDLHPRAFRAGSAATTSVAHVGVQLWQTDDAPSYTLAVARSFAGSLWSWLAEAGAEHGIEVV